MIIAVIDSGINKKIFKNYNINQYYVQKGIVTKELAKDSVGHGTSMLGIILRGQVEVDAILSLRPVICNGVLDNKDIAVAIKFAVDMGANVISVSMGNNLLKDTSNAN